MEILSTKDCAQADVEAARLGVSGMALMEAAGLAVTLEIVRRFDPQPVTVLCGPGNNGGDGYVIARLLARRGWPVTLAALGDLTALPADAAANARRWQRMGRSIVPMGDAHIAEGALVVDALFGAGLSRGMASPAAALIEQANAQAGAIVAVDMPSGVCGDTGEVLGEIAARADVTVTFFRPKPAHVLYPGAGLCGDVVLADIGIPEVVLGELSPVALLNTPQGWRWPTRGALDHKYTRGLACVHGAAEMSGAARLAARACRRVGAGMVRVVAPIEVRDAYLLTDPGLVFVPEGTVPDPRSGVSLIGCGLAADRATRDRVRDVLLSSVSVVLDAGGISAFADHAAVLFTLIKSGVEVVLTPHDGEFASLFGDLAGTKISRALQAARVCGAIIVIKGADTVIAHPDGRVAVNANAPPWLATAGSGDVLAGAIAGLLAQGLEAFDAACAAVWIHGEAAAHAGPGLIAEDLPDAIGTVIGKLS